MPAYRSFKCDIYKTRLTVVYGVSAYAKLLGRERVNSSLFTDDAVMASTEEIHPGWVVLAVKENQYGAGILVHESIHAAFIMLKHAGVVVDENNHEALAYLAEWIGRVSNRFLLSVIPSKDFI